MSVKITPQTLKVLSALIAAPNSSGAELCKVTGLATGTLYPILIRMEKAEMVKSEWEAGEPSQLGRPRRRFYKITGEGAQVARETAEEWAFTFGGLVAT